MDTILWVVALSGLAFGFIAFILVLVGPSQQDSYQAERNVILDRIQKLEKQNEELFESQDHLRKTLVVYDDWVETGVEGYFEKTFKKYESKIKDTSLIDEQEISKKLQQTWKDLDSTLSTMRTDFDASLNQRTASLTHYVNKSIESNKTDQEELSNIKERITALEKVSFEQKEAPDLTKILEMTEDHNERISEIESVIDEIQDGLAEVEMDIMEIDEVLDVENNEEEGYLDAYLSKIKEKFGNAIGKEDVTGKDVLIFMKNLFKKKRDE